MRAALKLKHVAGAIDYVRHCGGDEPAVTCNGAVHLTWMSDGRQLTISMSSKARDPERALQFARQDIRRAFKGAGVEVRA